MGKFDLVGSKVIWGSFSTFASKWPVSRKGLVLERNGVKFGIGDTSNTYGGMFDLVGFKVILGSFVALVSRYRVSPKRLVVDQN